MRRIFVVLGLFAAIAITVWGGLAVLRPAVTIEALVLPPEHSAGPAFSFELGQAQPAAIVAGSDILLHIQGHRAADMAITLSDGTPIKIEPAPSAGRWAELHAETADDLSLNLILGNKSRQVDLHMAADTPPSVRWRERPAHDLSGKVRLAFSAEDDLSITGIRLVIAASDAGLDINTPRTVLAALPLGTTQLTRSVHLDLADHPLAGQNAALLLEVTDGAGNVTRSAPAYLPLPKARLSDRTAQIIAALADELLTDPSATQKVATLLTAIAMSPQEYGDDLTSFLAMRVAYRRLTGLSLLYGLPRYPLPPATAEQVADVRPLLLDTARRIDDGPESTSYAIYESALESVPAALDNDDRRYQALSLLAYAVNAYSHDLTDDEILLSSEDLTGRLLLAIDDAAGRGDYASAQRALDTLTDLVENMSFGDAAIPPEGRLGVLAAIGSEAQGLQRLRDRILAASDELDRIADLNASLTRRTTTLRAILKKDALSGEAAPLVHAAANHMGEAGAALTAADWAQTNAHLDQALKLMADAGHITAQSIVSAAEGRLITATMPELPQNRTGGVPTALTAVSRGAQMVENLAEQRLRDCGNRREGQCAPSIRARLGRIIDGAANMAAQQ